MATSSSQTLFENIFRSPWNVGWNDTLQCVHACVSVLKVSVKGVCGMISGSVSRYQINPQDKEPWLYNSLLWIWLSTQTTYFLQIIFTCSTSSLSFQLVGVSLFHQVRQPYCHFRIASVLHWKCKFGRHVSILVSLCKLWALHS